MHLMATVNALTMDQGEMHRECSSWRRSIGDQSKNLAYALHERLKSGRSINAQYMASVIFWIQAHRPGSDLN